MNSMEYKKLKAIYIGPTEPANPSTHRSEMTHLKIYDVEQYVSADDPVYGNTYIVTADNGTQSIHSKDMFRLIINHDE